MIFSSRKVNELYQRYCRQVLKILRSPSYDLTGEECQTVTFFVVTDMSDRSLKENPVHRYFSKEKQ